MLPMLIFPKNPGWPTVIDTATSPAIAGPPIAATPSADARTKSSPRKRDCRDIDLLLAPSGPMNRRRWAAIAAYGFIIASIGFTQTCRPEATFGSRLEPSKRDPGRNFRPARALRKWPIIGR